MMGATLPRIAEVRDAAEPSSDEQRARHVRMLEAAAELGTEKELSRVQMHEVAKRAGVAIGTLYRYFPSKTHLFVAVMVEQIDQIGASFVRHQVQSDNPQDAVYEVLVRATSRVTASAGSLDCDAAVVQYRQRRDGAGRGEDRSRASGRSFSMRPGSRTLPRKTTPGCVC